MTTKRQAPRKGRAVLLALGAGLLLAAAGLLLWTQVQPNQGTGARPMFSDVSVHDPAIVKDGDTFYVFGSHISAAKSEDLMDWTSFANGYRKTGNTLYGDLSANLAESFAWAGENDSDSKNGFAVWAPDVFWNEDYVNGDGSTGAYMIYYSASSTYIRSAIGYAVSKQIEGPYAYGGTVLYSGFTRDEAYDADSVIDKKWTNTGIADLVAEGVLQGENPGWFNADGTFANHLYPNAIDAAVSRGTDGRLWMAYGSWSGGIFLLELDPATGQPVYPGEDGLTEDGRMIDRYFGIKLAGGYQKSGEGPHIEYNEDTGYYYLYMTYGWLGADGGYNMRVFRSESPDGPYTDAAGQPAVLPPGTENTAFGNKLMGNFRFPAAPGEAGTGYGYVSAGHNSVYTDARTGQLFLVFHTRFPQRGEEHELRVHQMFMNEAGWPAVAPYRYGGEKRTTLKAGDLAGDYEYVNHGQAYSGDIVASAQLTLHEDGTVDGAAAGSWKLAGGNRAELTLDGESYEGVFLRQWNETGTAERMTFTAVSPSGVAVWGIRQEAADDGQAVEEAAAALDLGRTDRVTADLMLPAETGRQVNIAWSSSDEAVISSSGKVNRPGEGQPAAEAVLTASLSRGAETRTVTFKVTVAPMEAARLSAVYALDGDLSDLEGNFREGEIAGSLIGEAGGRIGYAPGIKGQAAVLDGRSGILLDDRLIGGPAYSVTLWVNPEELTTHTSAFFAARNDEHWVSLVPQGPVSEQTMVWSGNQSWYDGATGLTIPAGAWTHLAFTADSGALAVYVNGERRFEGTGFPDLFSQGTAGTFTLGINWWDTPFQGMLDELRIYSGALTPDQVRELAQL